jgi:hypothetical protein
LLRGERGSYAFIVFTFADCDLWTNCRWLQHVGVSLSFENQAKEVQGTDMGASGGEETEKGEEKEADDKDAKFDKMEQG